MDEINLPISTEEGVKETRGETITLVRKRLSMFLRTWTNTDGFETSVWVARVRSKLNQRYYFQHLEAFPEDEAGARAEAIAWMASLGDSVESGILRKKGLLYYIKEYIAEHETRYQSERISEHRLQSIQLNMLWLERFWKHKNKPALDGFFTIYNREFEDWRMSIGSVRPSIPDGEHVALKPTSFNHLIQAHTQFLMWMIKKSVINPDTEITIEKLKGKAYKDEFPFNKYMPLLKLIQSEMKKPQRVRDLIGKHTYYTIIYTMMNTGMRVVEVRNMKWADLTEFEENKWLLDIRGKGKERQIIIPARVVKQLFKYKKFLESHDLINKAGYIFVKFTGESIASGQTSAHYVKNWFKELGVDTDNVNLGSIRHTFITLQVRRGINAMDIARYVGNSVSTINQFYYQPDTTQVYASIEDKLPEYLRDDKTDLADVDFSTPVIE